MGYHEIGIGAMTLTWTFISMAVCMAQDLGMHQNADGWRCPAQDWDPFFLPIFSASELKEQHQIWFGCVVMDQYVSVYIGRPLMICENDYDTDLPQLTQASLCPSHSDIPTWPPSSPKKWKVTTLMDNWLLLSLVILSHVSTSLFSFVCLVFFSLTLCSLFSLAGILSSIMRVIYVVLSFPTTSSGTCSSRETKKQVTTLESILNEWYLNLLEHLSHDIAVSPVNLPLPHVLTLHMQNWCAALLLHRPL